MALGLLCGLCAVGLGVALGLFVYGSPWSVWTFVSPGFWIPGALVLFFGSAAVRLLAGRGAAAGNGLLSRSGYCAFAAVLLCFGGLAVAGIAPGEPARAAAIGLAFLCLVSACLAAAYRARGSRDGDRPGHLGAGKCEGT